MSITASESVELKEKDILHSSRLGVFSSDAAEYTASIDIDVKLLSSVVAINSAHVIMLAERKILDRKIAGQILNALKQIPNDFEMKAELEDVHMNVEDYVISKIGNDSGGMMNLGKSRNDQVATAIRMALREDLILLAKSIVKLEKSLLVQSGKYSASVMPGYTHLQRGQPVTLGHHLLAHFDSLDRDFSRLVDCYLRTNLSPIGAGALSSTGFDIDRDRAAELLGFDSVLENSLDAVSSRDFATEAIYLCTQTMTDLSRLAEEIILWTTREFSFAEISDEFASTSSMMPQKKNAIVPEIFRAKTSQVLGDLTAAMGLMKSLPLSYNLDLQELTRNLWSAMDKAIVSISILSDVISELKFSVDNMMEAVKSDEFLFATELADYLVEKHHLSFREAHNRVGKLVRHVASNNSGRGQITTASPKVLSEILGVTIPAEELKLIFDPKLALQRRSAVGSPNPRLVKEAVKKRRESISKHEATINSLEDGISESRELLSSAANSIEKLGKGTGSLGR
ncbi:MAG: argininosuccinate lyase [Thaumarchaeota archaeon]|nr:argininosuccinate lyase [Nitrososphaerota archaeon]